MHKKRVGEKGGREGCSSIPQQRTVSPAVTVLAEAGAGQCADRKRGTSARRGSSCGR